MLRSLVKSACLHIPRTIAKRNFRNLPAPAPEVKEAREQFEKRLESRGLTIGDELLEVFTPVDDVANSPFDENLKNAFTKINNGNSKTNVTQSVTWPVMFSGRHFLLNTYEKPDMQMRLAYMLPMFQSIIVQRESEEEISKLNGYHSNSKQALALVIAASGEEVHAIYADAMKILEASGAKVDLAITYHEHDEKGDQHIGRIMKGTDIVIATPERLEALIKARIFKTSLCKSVVSESLDLSGGLQAHALTTSFPPDKQMVCFGTTPYVQLSKMPLEQMKGLKKLDTPDNYAQMFDEMYCNREVSRAPVMMELEVTEERRKELKREWHEVMLPNMREAIKENGGQDVLDEFEERMREYRKYIKTPYY